MRVSELAQRSGVSLSALKYYQREGMIPQGERRHPNQVDYSQAHVQRVRLIRALLETGGLSVAAAKEVLGTLDGADPPLAETFEIAQHALGGGGGDPWVSLPASRARVLQLARARGWSISDDNPGLEAAARALDGLLTIDFDPPPGYLDAYASAAETVARVDLEALSSLSSLDQIAERMIVGTVLGDPLFAGLRRLAQEDATGDAFPTSHHCIKRNEAQG